MFRCTQRSGFFSGYITESGTGFYATGTRYYDSEIERFINVDGYISNGQEITGYNMFAYCSNNPINRVDPNGYAWINVNKRFSDNWVEVKANIIFANVGCQKMVEGYTKFYVQEFKEFFEVKTLEGQEEYLASGKLDIYQREEVLFIPYIKAISYTECAILVFPYSQNVTGNVVINEVSLMTEEGDIISSTEKEQEVEVLSKWTDSMMLVNTFTKSDEWFYNGNDLVLIINASINVKDEMVEIEIIYDVNIVGYKGTSIQV